MKINDDIIISDTGFIFNSSTGDSYSLNPIGKKIISFIKEGVEKDKIINTLMNSYDVDNLTIEKDIDDFIKILKQYSLLQP